MGVAVAGLEEGQHGAAAVGGDLEGAAVEAGGPEVELGDGFEAEMLRVPLRGLGSVGPPDVYVVESPHEEGSRVLAHASSVDGAHGPLLGVVVWPAPLERFMCHRLEGSR